MNQDFFKRNQQKLAQHIQDNSAVILYSGKAPKKSADYRYRYTVNRHFYYITGLQESEIMMTLIKQNGEVTSCLYIKPHDPVMAKWVGETITKEEATAQSGIEQVQTLDTFEKTLHMMSEQMGIETFYFDLERDGFDEPESYEQKLAKTYRDKYPAITIKNVYPIISRLRMVKEQEEIDQLKTAIEITNEGILSLMKHAKAGMKEYQLEAYFDFEIKTRGAKDYAFNTIAASGANATVLHYEANDDTIKEDSLILFDLGAQYELYNADITRTFPVSGKFTDRQKVFYNIVLRAQREVIERIKPGVTTLELNQHVHQVYFEELQALGMVTTKEEVSKYYYHGVSHHLGLDTHDVNVRGVALEENMVITVEPGLYIEEEAIGIRIEDDVVVTATGCEVLSPQIIKTVDDIEAFMANR